MEDWVNDVESDIDYLHSSMPIDEIENRKCLVLEKWTSKGWTLWLSYFNKEWLTEARFSNWQMFHVPKGFPNANNPIESFNKIVKLIYTNHTVVSINELLKILTKKLVNFLSVQPKEFKYYREPSKTMIEKAKKLSENSFTRYDASSYWYHKQDKSDKSKFEYNKYVINRYNNQIYTDYDFLTCSCHCFYKLYVCKHVVRVPKQQVINVTLS